MDKLIICTLIDYIFCIVYNLFCAYDYSINRHCVVGQPLHKLSVFLCMCQSAINTTQQFQSENLDGKTEEFHYHPSGAV